MLRGQDLEAGGWRLGPGGWRAETTMGSKGDRHRLVESHNTTETTLTRFAQDVLKKTFQVIHQNAAGRAAGGGRVRPYGHILFSKPCEQGRSVQASDDDHKRAR
jgi:hypothetical protein